MITLLVTLILLRLTSFSEALILWMVEQCQIFGFGGTATCSISKSFINIVASGTTLSILLHLSMDSQMKWIQNINGMFYTLYVKNIIHKYILMISLPTIANECFQN